MSRSDPDVGRQPWNWVSPKLYTDPFWVMVQYPLPSEEDWMALTGDVVPVADP